MHKSCFPLGSVTISGNNRITLQFRGICPPDDRGMPASAETSLCRRADTHHLVTSDGFSSDNVISGICTCLDVTLSGEETVTPANKYGESYANDITNRSRHVFSVLYFPADLKTGATFVIENVVPFCLFFLIYRGT